MTTMPVDDHSPTRHYDAVYRTIHWLMAVLFLTAMGIGVWASFLKPGTSPRREMLDVHKSLGMTILVLVVVRLLYRLTHRPPAYPAALGRVVRVAASANHWILYAVMLAMPVTGYLASSAGGYSLHWFGLFDWPRLAAGDKPLAQLANMFHGWIAWIVYAVVAAHLGATLWHAVVKRDGTLARMLGSQKRVEATVGGGPRH